MTTPLNVDPNQLDGTGTRWYALVPELQGKPPGDPGTGPFPTYLAVQGVTAAGQTATAAQQERLAAAGANMQGGGKAYGEHDVGSAKDMTQMGTSLIKDGLGTLTNLGQSAGQTFSGVVGPLVSAAAAVGSAAASAASSLGAHGGGGAGQQPPGGPGMPVPLGAQGGLQGQAPEQHSDTGE
jgi:hypothetical protein